MISKQIGIEYLRFFLSLAVVFYHYFYYGPIEGHVSSYFEAWDGLVYGRFAVSAFFIISGYVIYFSAQGRSWRSFAASRVSRLYPALLICALITALAELPYQGENLFRLVRSLAAAWAFVPLYFSKGQIDPSYWSIVYELRFYVIVAILLCLSLFNRLVLLLTLAAVVGAGLQMLGMFPRLTGYILFPYVSFFAMGAILARVRNEGLGVVAVLLMGLHLLIAAYGTHISYERVDMFDGERSSFGVSLAVVAVCLALVLLVMRVTIHGRLAEIGQTLGAISYPLYLVHQLAGYRLLEALGPTLGAVGAGAVTVVAAILVAYAVHIGVERPLAGPLRTFLAGKPKPPGGKLEAAPVPG